MTNATNNQIAKTPEQMAVEAAYAAGFAAGQKAAAAAADATTMEKIRSRALKFTKPAAAERASHRSLKPTCGILGDDGKIWVVSIPDASWLESRGFEFAF